MKHSEKNVKIGRKIVGEGCPIYVIAEVGINHNGDISACKQLIDMAKDSGCDAVKFQKRTIDVVYDPEYLKEPRFVPISVIDNALLRVIFDEKDKSRIMQLIGTAGNIDGVNLTTRDQKRILEFERRDYMQIKEHCEKRNIDWFASPWDTKSVDFLEEFNVPCYKVASACLTDKELLEKIKKTGKPIILSTGMSEMHQIRNAVNFLGEDNLVLLSCVSTYPTNDRKELNLNFIRELQDSFNCPIGYSGHETDTLPTLMAMTLGAQVVERHITLSKTMYGSDQAASLEREGLEYICQKAKEIPTILGREKKRILPSEVPILKKLRRVDTFQ